MIFVFQVIEISDAVKTFLSAFKRQNAPLKEVWKNNSFT
jgi:hypothetical protein